MLTECVGLWGIPRQQWPRDLFVILFIIHPDVFVFFHEYLWSFFSIRDSPSPRYWSLKCLTGRSECSIVKFSMSSPQFHLSCCTKGLLTLHRFILSQLFCTKMFCNLNSSHTASCVVCPRTRDFTLQQLYEFDTIILYCLNNPNTILIFVLAGYYLLELVSEGFFFFNDNSKIPYRI